MEAIFNILRNFKALDEDSVFRTVFSQDKNRAYIISRNTWGQLFEKGVDSQGRILGYYSPATARIKGGIKKDGTPFSAGDHFTLRDSGDFYNSFRVKVYSGVLEIDADPMVPDGTNLFREFGEDILGLTEESTEQLIDYVHDDIIEEVTEKILRFD